MAHALSVVWQVFVVCMALLGLAIRLHQLWTLVSGAAAWLRGLVEDATGPRYTIPYTRPTRRVLGPPVARTRTPVTRRERRDRLASAPALRPRDGAARCAYCHDDLAGDVAACPGCRTLLHVACGAELARCPTPGCHASARLRRALQRAR